MDFQKLAEQLGHSAGGVNPDPYATLSWLRSTGPVQRVPGPDGTAVWFVTSYEDARRCLTDPRISFDPRNAGSMHATQAAHGYLLAKDAPEHTRLRDSATAAFMPGMVERMRPRIRKVCDSLIDTFRDSGHADLLADFALPIPEIVMSEFLGIPRAERIPLGRGTELSLLIALGDPAESEAAARELGQYVSAVVEYKKSQPGDDLTTTLIGALDRGELHDRRELEGMVYLLYSTGQFSTAPLIASAIARLLERPGEIRRAVTNPRALRTVVEETLRIDAAVQSTMPRYALEDLEMGGERIAKGDPIVVSLAGANRDPAQFDRPDDHRPHGKRRTHLGFGYGIHFCLGAPLARLEGEVALQALFEALPDLRLTVEPGAIQWVLGPMLRSPRELPAAF